MPKKKMKKTGNAFIDAIHSSQEKQHEVDGREVRVVMSDGMMAIKPVKGKQRGKRKR